MLFSEQRLTEFNGKDGKPYYLAVSRGRRYCLYRRLTSVIYLPD